MITGFVLETLPVLLLRLRALALDSYCYGLIRRVYHWLRRICCESWVGGILARHDQEGKIYDGSLFCRIFDRIVAGLVSIVRMLISCLTFGTYDSVVISLGRKAAARFRFLNFEGLCGALIFLMLVCPGAYWHNTYGLVIGLVLMAAFLIVTAMKDQTLLTMRMIGVPFVLFVFSTLVGIGIASSKSEAIRVFCFFLTAFLFCVVLIGAISDREKLKRVLFFIYLAMIVNALVAFYQRITGVDASASLTDLANNAGMPGRVFASFENPNNYAEILVLLLPVSFAYCTMLEGKKTRLAALLTLLLPVGALLMTYSRSSWVGFALAAVVFVFFYDKRLMPLFLVLGVLAIPLLPETVINRILTIGSTRDSSNMYRLYIWDSATDMIRDYGWIGLGLGPGNFRPVYLLYCHKFASPATHAHMLYLELWIELGLLGIGSFLAYYLTTIRNSVIRISTASKPIRITLIACVSSLAGISFTSAAEYIWFYPRVLFSFFILTGIAGAAIHIAKREQST